MSKKDWKRKKIKGNLSLFKKIAIIIVFIVLLFTAIFSVTMAWISRGLPNPNQLLNRQISETTKIYDNTGENLLYEVFSNQRRTIVDLEEIPQHLIHATITIEDDDFFTHQGFNIKSIIRAIIIDILHGSKIQGASTLTQQFVKNAFLTSEKTFKRKIKELLLAYKIEKEYSKQEILQMYFNEIPYGSNAYGAEAASQIYFGKSVRNLTLSESALLAALTKAPTYYSPYGNHNDELKYRQELILDIMAEKSFITEEKAKKAKEEDVFKNVKKIQADIVAPHFVMYVKQLLTQNLGQKKVEQGGLKVITTLDLEKQKIAEEAIDKQVKTNLEQFNANNASLVSISPKTGNIIAMVGSKDFFNKKIKGQVNVATRNRQPGSSFKPIVYANAFVKGYTPETILFDVPTNFGDSGAGKEYEPENYKNEYFGPVTIKQALAGSLNIPAVKTLYLVGLKDSLSLIKKFGYTTFNDPSRYGLSLVLGGGEVKLLEHVSAFSVFANNGKKIPYKSILKVEDKDGNILIDNQKRPKTKIILSPQIAKNINNILFDNKARSFVFGNKNNLTLKNRPVAAKTGTTNESRDAWTVGFTPNLIAGVWVGNTDNTKMKGKANGSSVAAPIWNYYMKNALKDKPIVEFEKPKPNYVDKPILKGILPKEETVTLKIDQISQKLATEYTPESLIVEKEFREYYPILHYIDKNNPQGKTPKNPNSDPQYKAWKEGINNWFNEVSKKPEEEIPFTIKNLNIQVPPTEKDDIHTIKNTPLIQIISPKNNQNVSKLKLPISVKVKTSLGIEKIITKIDDIQLNKITSQKKEETFDFNINLLGLERGNHEVEIIVFDKVKNRNSDIKTIYLSKNFKNQMLWQNPIDNQIIRSSNFPINISILVPIADIEKIQFYNQNLESNEIKLMSTIFNPEVGEEINFNWNIAEIGEYKLWSKVFEKNQNIKIEDSIKINIVQ